MINIVPIRYFAQLAKTGGNGLAKKELSDTQLEGIFLIFQGGNDTVDRPEISQACLKAGVSEQRCDECISAGSWTGSIPWLKFWALLVASTRTSLAATVDRCALLISGGTKAVASKPIHDILQYLAEKDNGVNKSALEAALKSILSADTIQLKDLAATVKKIAK